MKKVLLLVVLFFLFIIPVKAITVSSDAAILMDEDSKRVLFTKNINKQKLIASTTKIMTAVLAIESNKLDNIVVVDEIVLKAYGSSIYIEKDEKIKLRDLVYGLLLRSGNDAALVISSYLDGDEKSFVEKMNKKAKKIGMKNTSFVNASGLDEETSNISTPYDMALLMAYANNLSEFRKIVKTKIYKVKTNFKTYVWRNKNKLLDMYKYTTGGKTGWTDKANRTLVSSATKNNFNLIVVTLDDPDDWNTHMNLYEYGFNNYNKYKILNKLNFNLNSDYYKERLYIKNNYYYPLKITEKDNISLTAKLIKYKNYKNGDKVGEVEVYFKEELIHKENIYIDIPSSKRKLSLWKRILSWFNL